MTRLLITGANGHLGRRLINTLSSDVEVIAVVRSPRARRQLERYVAPRAGGVTVELDPTDPNALTAHAGAGDIAIHLVGTIKETRTNRYADSHQRPAHALAAMARQRGLSRIIYISILGAAPTARCECFRARAEVEAILRASGVPVTIIRVPMVLGEGDRASGALRRRVHARRVWLLRGDSLEQPIYAGDVINAVINSTRNTSTTSVTYDLAGPQSVTRRALVAQAAQMLNRTPTLYSLPLGVGLAAAAILERVRASPPITRDMLRVLDHDDAIDPTPAAHALGITLTPLVEMLRRCVANEFGVM